MIPNRHSVSAAQRFGLLAQETCTFKIQRKLEAVTSRSRFMTHQKKFLLSPDQQGHLDAWSMVYVDAHIQKKLCIPLSEFLRSPGKYLFIAWLDTSPPHRRS